MLECFRDHNSLTQMVQDIVLPRRKQRKGIRDLEGLYERRLCDNACSGIPRGRL